MLHEKWPSYSAKFCKNIEVPQERANYAARLKILCVLWKTVASSNYSASKWRWKI